MPLFKGLITALITPFTASDELDTQGLKLLLRRQVLAKVDGVVALGTTGESVNLSLQEREAILKICRQELPSHIPLIAGCATASTKETIERVRLAKLAGADAALLATPYYNRPSQDGLFHHFEAIAEAVDLPLLLYNIPSRTAVNLLPQTVEKLAKIPSIVGIKDSSDQWLQKQDLLFNLKNHFSILSGDDAATLPLISLGAHGVVSVLSNLLPQEVKKLVDACLIGDFNKARILHFQLFPLFKGIFMETNPVPIKAALEIVGLPAGKCRSPLPRFPQNLKPLLNTLVSPWFNAIPTSQN